MKTQAKSLICEHEFTKPRLVIEAKRNVYGHFQGTKMALCCAICGCRVPETPEYLDRQVA